MDDEKKARLAEAKRELEQVLQSLIGFDRPFCRQIATMPVTIFTGPVHIDRLVQCGNRREDWE